MDAKTESSTEPIQLAERRGHRQTEPFISLTGNPEAHDYADWARHQHIGEVVPFEQKKTP